MAGLQAGALADFLVGEVFIELEPDQFAAALVQGFQAQPHQADAFHARQFAHRATAADRRDRLAGVRAFAGVGFQRDNFLRPAAGGSRRDYAPFGRASAAARAPL